MKKLLLSLSICSLAGAAASAATVSGTVTSAATCSPASGQKVYLKDTFLNVTVDSAITSTSGYYSMNFPSGWSNPTPYMVSVPACGISYNSVGSYTGASATINAIICGAAKTLSGTLMLGSTPNTGAARVYLITVHRNMPTAGDTLLTAVDSVTLTNSPNFSFKRACAPSDTFLVKAMLLPSHPSYSSWLPSYDSSLNWSTATRYYGSSFNGMPHYLYMFAGSNPGGPGFIGGSVLVGANKGAAVGDPLPGRLMLLVKSTTNAPVAYAFSDAAGKFSFSNIATGTYKLMGDAWGLFNVPLTVTISSGSTSVSNIIFEENYGENTFKGRLTATAVGNVAGPLAAVRVYPNPASSLVTLLGSEQIRGAKTLVLHNIVGAEVMRSVFTDGQPASLNVAELPAGTYLLQLNTEAGTASFKVVK